MSTMYTLTVVSADSFGQERSGKGSTDAVRLAKKKLATNWHSDSEKTKINKNIFFVLA